MRSSESGVFLDIGHGLMDGSGNQGTDFQYVPREGFGWMNGKFSAEEL